MNASPQPKRIFQSQRPNEQVLLETRRHWWSWGRWFPVPVGIMLACWVLSAIVQPLAGILILMSLIFPTAILVYLYADWINDSIVVTDQRIVRTTNNLLRFSEQVSEIPITSIQEIQADIPNWDLFARVFRYGFVELKTSGNAGDVKLTMIPDPERMQEVILQDYSLGRATNNQQQQQQMQSNIQNWIQQGNATTPFGNTPVMSTQSVPPPPWSPFVQSFPTANGGTIYRKHWILWLRSIFMPTGVIIGAFAIFIAATVANLGVIGFGFGFVVLVMGGVWFYLADWDWRHDYLIVTDTTITILHQRPLWLQNEKDVLLLKRVDNIVAESQGLFNQLLNKGTVRFALIGGDSYKEFRDISHPLQIQGELTRRQGMSKRAIAEDQNAQQQQMMGQYISMYHEMVGAPRPQTPTQQAPITDASQAPAPYSAPIQANPFRDANRPPIVPQQRPAMTQGKPYVPPSNQTPFGTSQFSAPPPSAPPSRPIQPTQPTRLIQPTPLTPQTPRPSATPYRPPSPENLPPPPNSAPFPRAGQTPPPSNPPTNTPPRPPRFTK